jgi:FHA domain
MAACPYCRYENAEGVTRCVMCYAPLGVVVVGQPTGSLTRVGILPVAAPAVAKPRTKHTVLLGLNSIALYIDDADDPLVLELTHQAILGRHTPTSGPQPRVDLSPYGAVERGVSRMHAIIRRTTMGLSLQDLASSNGTWLNGVKLQAYIPNALKSGDRFKLSQLEIEVHFGNSVKKGDS